MYAPSVQYNFTVVIKVLFDVDILATILCYAAKQMSVRLALKVSITPNLQWKRRRKSRRKNEEKEENEGYEGEEEEEEK